ncbi:MAG: EF-hand domain-containing protein [Paracoccaceae bacterium]
MKRISLLLATVLGLGAVPALAQDAAAPEIADTDGNGTWSMEELVVAYPDLTSETFTSIDANADGAVDQAELAAALADGLLPAAE